MKMMILAALAVGTLGVGTAFSGDGSGLYVQNRYFERGTSQHAARDSTDTVVVANMQQQAANIDDLYDQSWYACQREAQETTTRGFIDTATTTTPPQKADGEGGSDDEYWHRYWRSNGIGSVTLPRISAFTCCHCRLCERGESLGWKPAYHHDALGKGGSGTLGSGCGGRGSKGVRRTPRYRLRPQTSRTASSTVAALWDEQGPRGEAVRPETETAQRRGAA